MTEKIKARVIGTCEINGVRPGGTVELDPDVTNVEALVYGEHIKLIPAKAPKDSGAEAKTGVSA